MICGIILDKKSDKQSLGGLVLSDFLYVIKMYSLELRHLDSVDSALIALVAVLATAAVERLLQVVGGEQAVDDRYLACCVEACDACRYALTDVVEVRSLAARMITAS